MKYKAGYIDIKQASKLVSVHPDTIRRLVKQHIGSSNIYKGKSPKAPYLINKDWLLTTYGLNEPHTAPTGGDNQKDDTTPTSESDKAISAVIEALTKQLEAQNKQIEKLTQLIDQSQQLQGLYLPATAKQTQTYEPTPEEQKEKTKPATAKQPKKKPTPKTPQVKGNKTKPTSNTKTKPPKKRWWRRG